MSEDEGEFNAVRIVANEPNTSKKR